MEHFIPSLPPSNRSSFLRMGGIVITLYVLTLSLMMRPAIGQLAVPDFNFARFDFQRFAQQTQQLAEGARKVGEALQKGASKWFNASGSSSDKSGPSSVRFVDSPDMTTTAPDTDDSDDEALLDFEISAGGGQVGASSGSSMNDIFHDSQGQEKSSITDPWKIKPIHNPPSAESTGSGSDGPPTPPPQPSKSAEFDFIVIGGGAAGCVLVDRLAAAMNEVSHNGSILVIERGGLRNATGAESTLFASTTPEAILNTKVSEPVVTPQGVQTNVGNVLGGGTSINGGLHIAENEEFFNHLREEYGWEMEQTQLEEAFDWINSPDAGLLSDSPSSLWSKARFKANEAGGYGPAHPIHSDRIMPGTFKTRTLFHNNKRTSTDTLCLRNPGKVTVLTDTEVKRILIDETPRYPSTKPVANCVEVETVPPEGLFSDSSSSSSSTSASQKIQACQLWGVGCTASSAPPKRQIQRFCVKRYGEIILSAGAIHTPMILMRSGIGPEAELQKLGIVPNLKLVNENVGKGLVDHPTLGVTTFFAGDVYPQFSAQEVYGTQNFRMDSLEQCPSGRIADPRCEFSISEELSGGRWSEFFAITFMNKQAALQDNDLLRASAILFDECGISPNDPICSPFIQPFLKCMRKGLITSTFLPLPKSRGSVTVGTDGKPVVDPAYFTDPNGEDLRQMRSALRRIFKIIQSATLNEEIEMEKEGSSCIDTTNQLLFGPLPLIRFEPSQTSPAMPRLERESSSFPSLYAQSNNFPSTQQDFIPPSKSPETEKKSRGVTVDFDQTIEAGLCDVHKLTEGTVEYLRESEGEYLRNSAEELSSVLRGPFSRQKGAGGDLEMRAWGHVSTLPQSDSTNSKPSTTPSSSSEGSPPSSGSRSSQGSLETRIARAEDVLMNDIFPYLYNKTKNAASSHLAMKEGEHLLTRRPATFPPYPKNIDDDKELDEFILQQFGSIWHHCGTAAQQKVVDEKFKVSHIQGLRVIDASVLPQTPRVNSMGVVLALGYVGAKMIAYEHCITP